MSQFPGQYGYQPAPVPPTRRGMPTWAKILIGFVVAGGVLTVLCCGGIIWFGITSPETFVVTGSQMRNDHVQQISDLGLLDPGERIELFYSDGFLDIEEGMYFLTDRKLVIYSESWDEPATIINWDEIADIKVEYNDSFFEDSMIWITFADDSWIVFPVSSESGGDQKFYEALRKKWEAAGGGGP